MNTEQLIKGNELTQKIESAKKEIKSWNLATAFLSGSIYMLTETGASVHGKASPELFTIAKALSLTYWQNLIDQLEKELAEL